MGRPLRCTSVLGGRPLSFGRLLLTLLMIGGSAASGLADEGTISLENLLVPRDRILSGGPPKGGIPALTAPHVTLGTSAPLLQPTDRVIGVSIGGEHRAYPLKILNWHEIVNDTLGEMPIVVTYCPLCDSAVVFRRTVEDQVLEFGVSGLLYKSNVLMYDRSSGAQSLWSQMAGRALSGPFSGAELSSVPVELSTWGNWISKHPQTTVLTPHTGYRRRYDQDPYADYFRSPRLMFPVGAVDARLPTKSRVLGVEVNGEAKAYPIPDPNPARGTWEDTLGEETLRFATDPNSGNIRVLEPPVEANITYSLWYAWYAFHPATEVYSH